MISIMELLSLAVTASQHIRTATNLFVEKSDFFFSMDGFFLKGLVTSDVEIKHLVTFCYCWILCLNREDAHYMFIFVINV
jgi:hypothetical protein